MLEPVELRGRPVRDLGQLVVQLEDARVVVGQAAEGRADLVQDAVDDDGLHDRLGGLAVQEPVGPVQHRPQVRQHLRDQRRGRDGQPPVQNGGLDRAVARQPPGRGDGVRCDRCVLRPQPRRHRRGVDERRQRPGVGVRRLVAGGPAAAAAALRADRRGRPSLACLAAPSGRPPPAPRERSAEARPEARQRAAQCLPSRLLPPMTTTLRPTSDSSRRREWLWDNRSRCGQGSAHGQQVEGRHLSAGGIRLRLRNRPKGWWAAERRTVSWVARRWPLAVALSGGRRAPPVGSGESGSDGGPAVTAARHQRRHGTNGGAVALSGEGPTTGGAREQGEAEAERRPASRTGPRRSGTPTHLRTERQPRPTAPATRTTPRPSRPLRPPPPP